MKHKTDKTNGKLLFDKKIDEVWLNADEASEYLRVSKGTLRNMTSNGTVPVYKLSCRRCRYRLEDLRNLLLKGKKGG